MSVVTALPVASLTVLALEPDSGKANAIRQIVSAIADASLTVVRSKDHLLEALRCGVPDLVLLPVLLPWADETQLIDALRSISERRHLEVVVTPYEIAHESTEGEENDALTGWRRLLKKPPPHRKLPDAASAPSGSV